MGGCGHTQEQHDAMKADDAVWASLVLIGYQLVDDECDFELRNVPGTECTLSRRCHLTPDEREAARAAARAKYDRFRAQVNEAVGRHA